MKQKEYKEKYSKKVSKKPIKEKKMIDTKWIVIISIITFLISLSFSFLGEVIIPNAHIVISIFLLVFFIFLGILFDIIGVSVTVADIKTFNSMAAKKVKGASLAVKYIKNSNKVSSFLNDVIGDICGIVSGSTGISIAILLSEKFNLNLLAVTLLMTALISTITIGGKAIGKSFAINKSNQILFAFVKVVSIFYKG
jgi:CBS domain containing-hemolysin-like protein